MENKINNNMLNYNKNNKNKKGEKLRNSNDKLKDKIKDNKSINNKKDDIKIKELVQSDININLKQNNNRNKSEETDKGINNQAIKINVIENVYQNLKTLYFPIDSVKSNSKEVTEIEANRFLNYNFSFKCYKNAPLCLLTPLQEVGFKKTQSLKKATLIWKLYNHEKMLKIISSLDKHQKFNHFPKTFQLGRKDNLYRHFKKMKKKFSEDYSFIPTSYILPADAKDFYKQIKINNNKNNSKDIFIVKPVNSSRGRGIHLLTEFNKEILNEDCLISKYISNPHLIEKRKYDLRIYVLITSFSPLRIYMFNEGLVRFSSEDYNLEDKDNIFVHLTNYSINKKNKDGEKAENIKWSLEQYKMYLNKIDESLYFKIIQKIKDVIIKTILLITEETNLIVKTLTKNTSNLFELYGFDILIDENFKAWLLEVNTNPSLNCDSELDLKLKTNLIKDIFNIIGFRANLNNESVENSANNITFKDAIKDLPLINLPNNNLSELKQLRINICKDWSLNKSFEISNTTLKAYDSIIKEFLDEKYRKENFSLIFPKNKNIEYYSQFLDSPNDENIVLWKSIKTRNIK